MMTYESRRFEISQLFIDIECLQMSHHLGEWTVKGKLVLGCTNLTLLVHLILLSGITSGISLCPHIVNRKKTCYSYLYIWDDIDRQMGG